MAKHWLYYLADALPPARDWPLQYPTPDPDGLSRMDDTLTIDTDGDGIFDASDGIPDTLVNDVEGDAVVMGTLFASPTEAGTCTAPLDLATTAGRAQVNSFSKLGAAGTSSTRLWVKTGGKTYRLTVSRPLLRPDFSLNATPGEDRMVVNFSSAELISCNGTRLKPATTQGFEMRLDPRLNEFLMVDGPVVAGFAPADPGGGGGGGGATEAFPNQWDQKDVVGSASCGIGKPFTGYGWENNYDSGVATGDPDFDAQVTDVDRFCAEEDEEDSCVEVRPVQQTTVSVYGRALDTGDVLPFDWATSNKDEMLRRLAPNHGAEVPDFRVSSYFRDDVGRDGFLELADVNRRPLIAHGDTPLGKAILDFRCWYMGDDGTGANAGKCRAESAFGESGWQDVACTFDPEYGCRRPYLILITDGADTCAGENPAADVAAMNSHSGIKTWALNVGDPDECKNGLLHTLAQNGKGECIDVATKEELRNALLDIVGQIIEEARSFASAAVPSLQAVADQVIYVSSFTPLNDKAQWDGHLDAFLKPLPLDPDGRPDRDHENHLWDGGDVMVDNQYNAADFLGPAANQRRVYYSREGESGAWPAGRRLLELASDDATRYDLWRGMKIAGCDAADGTLPDEEEVICDQQAGLVINGALAKRSAVLADSGENVEYLLGDIFHSNPIIVGTPVNSRYFALDLGEDQDEECQADDAIGNANRGYRCFLSRHLRRRRLLAFGANDGMMHALEAGIFRPSDGAYDNGSGHELFGYVPRPALAVLQEVVTSGATDHRWSVDGPVAGADVFIDPQFTGAPDPAERLWRTVLLGGLREGGTAYYALDVTQPDALVEQADGSFLPAGGPSYLPSCIDGGTGCGPLPYPAALWEFADTSDDSQLAAGEEAPEPAVPMNEDADAVGSLGGNDLAFTWSVPVIGRIRICGGSDCDPTQADNDLEDHYVAVFGNGIDPALKASRTANGWLFMVDIETGRVLYKEPVLGLVPAQPAAVDTDQDGYLDRIYAGTTAGQLYRVDLGPDDNGDLPGLEPVEVTIGGEAVDVLRIRAENWRPRLLFDANFDGTTPFAAELAPRAIFQTPSVVAVSRLGLYALAFGTGDREDLWVTPPGPTGAPQDGRFYLFVDDADLLDPADLPLSEGDFVRVGVADPPVSDDLLLTRSIGQRGWYLVLDANERVITDSFALSGVTIFSSYQPDIAITDEDGDPIAGGGTCDVRKDDDVDNLCAKTGVSRVFVVNTTNASPFLSDLLGSKVRYLEVSTFVTNPYSEAGQNKSADGGDDGEPNADEMTPSELAVMEALKGLFPANCTFANYWIDIKTVSADTRIQRIASIPVCVVSKNWKEF